MGSISTYPAVVDGPSVVERATRMTANGSRARVSMIPSSFDLRAFDEMFRTSNAQLQRWTSRPALVILASVMDYRNSSDQIYTATGEQLTDAEVEQLKAHLMEGLAFLTGNTFTSFASVEIERPAGGARVNTLAPGRSWSAATTGCDLAKTIGYGHVVGTARRQHRSAAPCISIAISTRTTTGGGCCGFTSSATPSATSTSSRGPRS